MIIPLGKHLRKWLLSVAVAARDRVQDVVDALDSASEAQQAAQAGFEVGRSPAKMAQPGGPPDHWVQLVARHAPELLQLGPPHVANRQAWISDRDAGRDDRPPDNSGGPAADHGLPTQEIQSPSPESYQVPREFEGPVHEPQAAVRRYAGKSGGDAMVGIDKSAREPGRDGATISQSNAVRSGLSRQRLTANLPSDERWTQQRKTPGRKRRQDAIPPEKPTAESGDSGNADKINMETGDIESNGNTTEKQLTDATQIRTPGAVIAAGKSNEAVYQREQESSPYAQYAARVPNAGEIKRAANNGSQPGRRGSLQPVAAIPDGVVNTTTPQTRTGRGSDGPAMSARETGGRRQDDEGLRVEEIPVGTKPPGDRRWPALPGEKEIAVASNYSQPGIWPDLPAGPSARALAPADQVQSYPAAGRIPNKERLRRIDEEQKGKSWSASHF